MQYSKKSTAINIPRVVYRACPDCGHTVTQKEIEDARIDFPCAGCGERKQSEFVIKSKE